MTKYTDRDTQQITVRVEKSLLQAMSERGVLEGMDRTDIVVKALQSYLGTGKTTTELELIDRISKIENTLSTLLKLSEKHDDIVGNLTKTIAALITDKK